jgi:hypothetical protein
MFHESDPLLDLFGSALKPISADRRRSSRNPWCGAATGVETLMTAPLRIIPSDTSAADSDAPTTCCIDVFLSPVGVASTANETHHHHAAAAVSSPKSPHHAAPVPLAIIRARAQLLRLSPAAAAPSVKENRQWKALVSAIHYTSKSAALQLDDDDDVMDAEFTPAQFNSLAQWAASRFHGSKHRKFGTSPVGAAAAVSASTYASPARANDLRSASPRHLRDNNNTRSESSLYPSPRSHQHTTRPLDSSDPGSAPDSIYSSSIPSASSAPKTSNVVVQICGLDVHLNPLGNINKAEVRDVLHRLGYTTAILDDETFAVLFHDTDIDNDEALTESELVTLLTSFGEDNL